MPRPRKVQPTVNNGPENLPPITQAEQAAHTAARASNAKNFPEAYETTGKPIETVKVERFGPGADYASNSITIRYHQPDTGRTFVFAWADASFDVVNDYCDMLEEQGLLPCVAIDRPKDTDRADLMDEDKKIGKTARKTAPKPRQRRLEEEDEEEDDDLFDDEEDDSPIISFGRYNGQSMQQVYDSGARGKSYIEWLAKEARQSDIKKAARLLIKNNR